jgi:uncharacterized protein YfiM (DUF2279 family)
MVASPVCGMSDPAAHGAGTIARMQLWTRRDFWGLALVFACSLLADAPAHAQDSWGGADKGKHFAASAVLAAGGYASALWLVDEPWQRAAIGGGFAFGLGIAKELYDATGRGDPSFRDLTWDLIGCAFGVSTALLLDYVLRAPEPVPPHTVHVRPRPAAW